MTFAFTVTEASQVAPARRHASELAARHGFPPGRAGDLALVVAELGTNLVKHADGGRLLIQELRGDPPGIEIIAIDRGPGLSDVAAALADGHSTAGSLGYGLGAIKRLSDTFEMFSASGGTIALSRLWTTARHAQPAGFTHGAVSVAYEGEPVCGDAWRVHLEDGTATILVADGLGHGALASDAAEEAARVFEQMPHRRAADTVGAIHQALGHTRGAAVAVAHVDRASDLVTYAGLGNIAGVVVAPDGTRHSMVSHNGTAGHMARQIREFSYEARAGACVVLHSDGLTAHHPPPDGRIWAADPAVAAAVLYRDCGRARDDATVVVVRREA